MLCVCVQVERQRRRLDSAGDARHHHVPAGKGCAVIRFRFFPMEIFDMKMFIGRRFKDYTFIEIIDTALVLNNRQSKPGLDPCQEPSPVICNVEMVRVL